jgi:hypothetical protein
VACAISQTPDRVTARKSGVAVARMFVLMSPVAVPAGLALAAALWSWRNYAISAGIGGRMASAPVTFDNRQWKRQVAAAGRTAAPGNVPVLTDGPRCLRGSGLRGAGAVKCIQFGVGKGCRGSGDAGGDRRGAARGVREP